MMLSILGLLNDVAYDALPMALTVMAFVITVKYLRTPDLTAAGSYVLGAAVAAYSVVNFGLTPWLALALAVLAGAVAGGVTAFFTLVLRIDRLLAGILSSFVFYGVNQLILRTATLPYGSHLTVLSWAESRDRLIGHGGLSWHPFAILLFLGVVAAAKLLLDYFLNSEVGLALRALEDANAGEEVLRRQGLTPEWFQCVGLVGANALVGLTGGLISMRAGAANVEDGFAVVVTGLVAFLLGAQAFALLKLQSGSRWAFLRYLSKTRPTTTAVLGALAYFSLIDLAQQVEVRPELSQLVLGLIVVAAVADWGYVTRLTSSRRTAEAAPAVEQSLLSFDRVSFRYPGADNTCLQQQNLTLKRGELLAVRGSNGVGKSTLLKIMAGLLVPTEGKIRFRGRDVTGNTSLLRRNVVYVDQNADRGVVGCLRVEEVLSLARAGNRPSFWRKAIRHDSSQALAKTIQDAGIEAGYLENDAATLSGGQRQITNLLTLLARERVPEVILLDEPTNNLDSIHSRRCHEIIHKLRERGATVVLVSHSGFENMPDREVILKRQDELNAKHAPALAT